MISSCSALSPATPMAPISVSLAADPALLAWVEILARLIALVQARHARVGVVCLAGLRRRFGPCLSRRRNDDPADPRRSFDAASQTPSGTSSGLDHTKSRAASAGTYECAEWIRAKRHPSSSDDEARGVTRATRARAASGASTRNCEPTTNLQPHSEFWPSWRVSAAWQLHSNRVVVHSPSTASTRHVRGTMPTTCFSACRCSSWQSAAATSTIAC